MQFLFVSSNVNKFQEIENILNEYHIKISFHKAELPEIQSDSLEEFALFSAKHAFSQLEQPLFVEDTGLFIQGLNGFPGPYASYIFKTIGNQGVLKLLRDEMNREAIFRTVYALILSDSESFTFIGETRGTIAQEEKGNEGWGYDPIFIPDEGDGQTYAEMGIMKKNKISHRQRSLRKMVEWVKKELSPFF